MAILLKEKIMNGFAGHPIFPLSSKKLKILNINNINVL
jgi:hypothetical protein